MMRIPTLIDNEEIIDTVRDIVFDMDIGSLVRQVKLRQYFREIDSDD